MRCCAVNKRSCFWYSGCLGSSVSEPPVAAIPGARLNLDPSHPITFSKVALIATLLLVATGTTVVDAQTKYWDIDATSRAGAGSATPTGVWSATSTHWNSDSTGLGIPTSW